MVDGNPLINFGDLSKPVTVFIEKISDAVGGCFRPLQIKRIAKAETEAALLKAKNDIEITDLHQQAIRRFVEEEARRQENIQRITQKAMPLIEESSNPGKMENDWITHFFDKCRIVTDEEMQSLWAKVLAGEANVPGTYSKRTVTFISVLEKSEAQLFAVLCRFCWTMKSLGPVIFDPKDSIYKNQGIGFDSLTHLASIGLISFEGLGDYLITTMQQKVKVSYFDRKVAIGFKKSDSYKLDMGKAIFTQTGKELANICASEPVEGFFDYVISKWKKDNSILSIEEIKPPFDENS